MAKVEFYIDGTKIAEDTTAPYELNWDSQSVDDGEHVIKAAAVDTIGQRKEVSINVVVRNRDVYDYAYRWSTQWNNSYGGGNPNSLAVNNKRNSVYVTFHERIEVYSLAGTFLFAITKPSNDEYPLTNDMRIAVDANGNIYVTCPDVQTVVKFDAAGKFVKKWGTKGSGNGQFTRAQGIACDSQGNVYVCDGYNNSDKWATRGSRSSTPTEPSLAPLAARAGTTANSRIPPISTLTPPTISMSPTTGIIA